MIVCLSVYGQSRKVIIGETSLCFSIFFRGCKLLKSFHFFISPAKIEFIIGINAALLYF